MPPRVEFEQQSLRKVAGDFDKLETEQGLSGDIKEKRQSHLTSSNQHQNDTTTSTSTHIPTAAKTYFKTEIVWRNVILMSLLHIGALLGLRQCFVSARWPTMALAYTLYILSGLGITAGAHRLWSHRSYKAKWPLRLFLAYCNTMAFQNSIFEWSRDHRVHHKYSETDADPHNALRGFFFSHIGWLLSRKHPEVKLKGEQIDLHDLTADPIVRFQHRYYTPLVISACFVIPTLIPHYLWGESLYNAFYICALLRYTLQLHTTWLVNSAAHMWGRRPYDTGINPSENKLVSIGALGEGFHNYHHTFPWDYATSELGYELNFTKLFIDFMAFIGWAYERKVVKPDMIRQRKLRTGDTHENGPYGPYN